MASFIKDVSAYFTTWAKPSIELHHQATLQDSAIEHADCPICFDSLHKNSITVYTTSNGKRVCSHMFCQTCAERWGVTHTTCPLCRAEFSASQTYNFDHNNCFGLFDVDNSGTIDKKECTTALTVLLPYRESDIEKFVERHWHGWDTDQSNSIDEDEFGQIVHAIQTELKNVPATVPTLNSEEWFEYWDEDQSNSLDLNELTLALIHTFGLHGHENHRRDEFIKMIPLIVTFLDPNGDQIISKDEWPEFRANLLANL